MIARAPLAAIIASFLLTGCTSNQPSETARLQEHFTRTVHTLETRLSALENGARQSTVCTVSTPSGDVVVPCAGTSHMSLSPPNSQGGNPAYRQARY